MQVIGRGSQDGRNTAATKAGVVAFATSGDAELGEYDEEPTMIFKAGRVPAPFEDA